MPNVFVVGDQKNLADLASVLLRSRTSAAVRDFALAAIRRANPSLDFDRITPGTVIVFPPVEGLRSDVPADPVRAAADDLVDRLRQGMESLAVGAEQAEALRGAEKKEVQDLFGTALVKRLAAEEPELVANIESVRAAFRQDDAAAKQQLSDLRQSLATWSEDLGALGGLL